MSEFHIESNSFIGKALSTKKDGNIRLVMEKLKENRIPHVIKRGGRLITVDNLINYYPTTGSFVHIETKKEGKGINELLKNFKDRND
jgi:hypothetical protein